MLVTAREATEAAPEPAKTLPAHFSPARLALAEDVELVFGKESADFRSFSLGSPPEMAGVPICIDLSRFAERSSGIFGKTGTGKTLLTKLILGGLMRHNAVSCLIFDAHNEYAREVPDETGAVHPTLANLFAGSVETLTLGQPRAGGKPLLVEYGDVEPEDILLLQGELRLTATFPDVVNAFHLKYKKGWLEGLLALADTGMDDFKAIAEELGLHLGSLQASVRRLKPLLRIPWLVEKRPPGSLDPTEAVVQQLKHRRHVILEMGGSHDMLGYLFAANVITRRLHETYMKDTYASIEKGGEEPRDCLVVVEEAHRLISRELSGETVFGVIAREMRKFHVSLLLVDQRPSGIDPEVLSQVGTKLIMLLDDPHDLEAVLSGQVEAAELRRMVARLASKQQALVLGYAVPMPVVLSVRPYDQSYAQAVGKTQRSEPGGDVQAESDRRFGFA
jgi:DNA helicase HerA-like ATPase